MPYYLIEFRFSGYVKKQLKELIQNISKTFHVRGLSKRRIVPHITLIGTLYTTDKKKLVKEVTDIVKKYDLIGFQLDGFGNFQRQVIHVNITPSEELLHLRNQLAERLAKFCKLDEHDFELEFKPHATLALKDITKKFDKIMEYLNSWKIPKITQHVLRVTILDRDSKIFYEYDLMQKKLLNRSEAKDKKIFKKTLEISKKKRDTPSRVYLESNEDQNAGKIFLISDMHFDHQNIIKYCNRPFRSKDEMNKALLANWNSLLGDSEKLYYLGDLCYGRGRKPIDYWLSKLNGEICFIRGNHDTDIITKAEVLEDKYLIKYKNYKFLLMHDPYRPTNWDGWIIHGDKHNNDLKDYPFINQKNKTVNVCAEVVNYTPLNLDTIISMIETGRSYKTLNS